MSAASWPAISPAMNVPWPNVSRFVRLGAWDSSERSGPYATLSAPSRPGTGETPESMRATSMPAPVYPLSHQLGAPMTSIVFFVEFASLFG